MYIIIYANCNNRLDKLLHVFPYYYFIYYLLYLIHAYFIQKYIIKSRLHLLIDSSNLRCDKISDIWIMHRTKFWHLQKFTE
jgi:hypothetical protein